MYSWITSLQGRLTLGFALVLALSIASVSVYSAYATRIETERFTEEIELAPTEVEDNLEETEGLLRDVEAPIVIELGRLQMNTAQVIRLKAGQILRLPRGATDPVDLVVNDKVFARGELIEVDGELGVRLVQVTGA